LPAGDRRHHGRLFEEHIMIRYASILAVLTLVLSTTLSHATMSPSIPKRDGKIRAEIKYTNESEPSRVGIQSLCHVDSRVDAYIRVYINGEYQGTMAPFGDISSLIDDLPGQVTDLYAVSTCGRYSWSRTVVGSFSNFQWILYP
jgi:hypothetical protein